MMPKYLLDRIISLVREEMSFSSGGGSFYRGSAKGDSGSPTAGYDPLLGYDGRKSRYKNLSTFYKDATKSERKDVLKRRRKTSSS